MFVACHTSVGAGVRLCHFWDLQLGILAFVLDGDPATRGDLPPFTLHPLHVRDGLSSNLGNELCCSLFKMKRSQMSRKATFHLIRTFLIFFKSWCLGILVNVSFSARLIIQGKCCCSSWSTWSWGVQGVHLLSGTETFLGSSMKKRLSSLLIGGGVTGMAASAGTPLSPFSESKRKVRGKEGSTRADNIWKSISCVNHVTEVHFLENQLLRKGPLKAEYSIKRSKRVPLTVTLALQKVLPAALLALHR